MKKVFLLSFLSFFALLLVLVPNSKVSAQDLGEKVEFEIDFEGGSGNEFDMILERDPNVISPLASWTGTAGTARLDYMSGARAFSWGIVVPSGGAMVFTGRIDISTESTRAHRGSIYVSGSGVTRFGGTAYIPGNITLRSGTRYTAKFSGTAVSGGRQVFNVTPRAFMGFQY